MGWGMNVGGACLRAWFAMRRGASLAAAVALMVGLLGGAGQVSARADSDARLDVAAQAATSGERVEILGDRTESSRT